MPEDYEDIDESLGAKPKRRKGNVLDNLSKYVFGKVPPQARDMEEAVLGAIMLEKDAVAPVMLILKPDSFYTDAHQFVFKAISDLFHRDKPIDLLTVVEELTRQGLMEKVGGTSSVMDLTNRVTSAANVEYHARIVQEKYVGRELLRISSTVMERAYDDSFDLLDVLTYAEKQIDKVREEISGNSMKSFSSMVSETEADVLEMADHKKEILGISTGHKLMDELVSGRINGEVTLIGALPSMGKSAFVNKEIQHVALVLNLPIAVFTLETKFKQWVINQISNITKINSNLVRLGRIDKMTLREASKTLAEANIFLFDSADLHIYDFQAKTRMLKKKYGIVEVVVDYAQLMQGERKGSSREEEIASVSRGYKKVAMDEDIPVIALAQVDKGIEKRSGDKRPKIADLRESAALGHNADVIQFLHRPEYFGEFFDKKNNDMRGIMELITAKHRNGEVKSLFYKWIKEYGEYFEHPFMNTASASILPATGFSAAPPSDDLPF